MLYQIAYLFIIFIIYSLFGWTVEIIAVYLDTKKIINRGFLIGPYCPIYGVAALILVLVLSKYKHDIINFYILFVVIASVLEYFTSYLLEKMFNARWWDYSHIKYNLNGRICLVNSLAFGVLGIFVCYLLNPLLISVLDVIPKNVLIIISLIIMILFIIDLCISFKILTRLKKNIVLLNKDMTEDINKQVVNFIEKNHILKAFPLLNEKIDSNKKNNS